MTKRMVTRTVTETEFTAVTYNTELKATEEVHLSMPGEYDGREKLMKAVKKAFPEYTIVDVNDVFKKETRYGMEESTFISMAAELPAITK